MIFSVLGTASVARLAGQALRRRAAIGCATYAVLAGYEAGTALVG